MKLPSIKDDEGQEIEVQTFLSNKLDLPSFISFDTDSLTYSINPSLEEQVGEYPVQVTLTDSAGASKSYSFNINVRST